MHNKFAWVSESVGGCICGEVWMCGGVGWCVDVCWGGLTAEAVGFLKAAHTATRAAQTHGVLVYTHVVCTALVTQEHGPRCVGQNTQSAVSTW